MYIGLTGRHLLDNNPAPTWLKHTPRGTVLLQPNSVVPLTEYTQSQCLDIARGVATKWINNRVVHLSGTNDYIAKFSGTKRNRLVEGINKTGERNSLDFSVTGFVKCDKYDPATVVSKPPRMIQFRAPGTNAELAKFMEPVEHELLLGPGLGPTGLPECSKGMTLARRAQVWHEKRSAIPNAACWLLDFKKFDCHVHTHTLALEHGVWREMTNLPLKMLDKQLINNCRAGPWKYKAVGTRMSGDRNTGGGNSIINVMIVRTVAEAAGIDVEFLCDGDDSQLWLERSKAELFYAVASEIVPKVFGMVLEGELAETIGKEEYCHTALCYTDMGEPRCVVDPIRHLKRACWTVNRSGRNQCAAIFIGNLVSTYLMYPNSPVLSRCCYNILASIGALNAENEVCCHYEYGEGDQWRKEFIGLHLGSHTMTKAGRITTTLPVSYMEISEDARAQLSLTFGISPAEQVLLESTYHVGELNPILRLKQTQSKVPTRAELRTQCDTVSMVHQ